MTPPARHQRARHSFIVVSLSLLISACGGGGGGDNSGGGGGGGGGGETSYTVTTSAGANGQISPGSATVNEGATATFTVTPNSDYDIERVTGCDGTLSGNTFTTAPILNDCAVSATFAPKPTVTAIAGSNGSISPGSAKVSKGATTSFTVTPDSDYLVGSITGCGGALSGSTYTTGPVTADCTVNATFVPTLMVVTAVAGSGGGISPDSAKVVKGATTSFTVTPDSDYTIAGVTGCGGSLSGSTYTTGPVFADCTVSATFAKPTVTAIAGSGGNISPGSATVNEGATATFTVIPDSDYAIVGVTGCDGSLNGSTYTTGPVFADCTVNATFVPTLTVTAIAGSNGAISPGSATVNEGATATFTVTPNSDYAIASVTGCGGSLSGNTYTTGPITADCTVSATFAKPTVTAIAGSGGGISPGSITLNSGLTTSFTVTPDSDYDIDSVTGCGGTLSGSTYTTSPVIADCTVNATFSPKPIVTAIAGSNGSISPASVMVSKGTTTSFTVIPDSDYAIDRVTGCGGYLHGSTYTISSVVADCTVSATFAKPTVTAIAGTGGSISPGSVTLNSGLTTSFTVTPDTGYRIQFVQGCGGSLSGNTYTTGPITADCTVRAYFLLPIVTISDAITLEDKGSLIVTASLTFPANGDATVDYTTADGSATAADNDYTPVSGTLTINSGTTSNTFSVPINSDTTPESDETVILTLSNASANTRLINATAMGTILNDEPTGALNDTGVTLCGDYAYGTGSGIHNNVDCAAAGATTSMDGTETGYGLDPVPAGQDALYGRDATDNDDSDGVAGFVFTKIDSTGTALKSGVDSWDCVLDRVTGLMWEVKTDDGGLRDKDHTYTWYNSDSATNGGDAGTANGGSCYDSINCDTEKYVAQVNASGLCGYSDWRMPKQDELQSIATMEINKAGPKIDLNYFPARPSSATYWSSSPRANDSSSALSYYFIFSQPNIQPKSNAHSVRLVRTGQ